MKIASSLKLQESFQEELATSIHLGWQTYDSIHRITCLPNFFQSQRGMRTRLETMGISRAAGGVPTQLHPDDQDTSDPGTIGQKRLRVPAPKCSGKADMYKYWCWSFLSYTDFHAFIGCSTGNVKNDFSRVKYESRPVAEGFTARSFDVSKIAAFALRTGCDGSAFQSICQRCPFTHEIWNCSTPRIFQRRERAPTRLD